MKPKPKDSPKKRHQRPKSGTGTLKRDKRSVARHKSATAAFGEATFDDAKRKDWVTGYRKRKVGRRKQAQHDAEQRARRERIAARKARRDAERVALGLVDDEGERASRGVGDAVERDDADVDAAYASGVTVTVRAGLGASDDGF